MGLIGYYPDLLPIPAQSSPLRSHLVVTRILGTLRTPSTGTPDTTLTRNPSLFRLLSLSPSNGPVQ